MQMDAFWGDLGFKIQVVGGIGRCLVADRHFSAGSLLCECPPLAAVPATRLRTSLCHNCFCYGSGGNHKVLSCCARCKMAYYCSRMCQREDWKHHKLECKSIIRISPNTASAPIYLAARVMNIIKGEDKCDMDVDIDILSDLVSHWDEIKKDEEKALEYVQAAQLTKAFITSDQEEEEEEDGTDVRQILDLLSKFTINNFTITDDELQPLGDGLYPRIACCINHSCLPNAIVTFVGTTLQLRALDEIQSGAEVSISYIDIYGTLERRTADLAKYYITCRCEKCTSVDESKVSTDATVLVDELLSQQKKLIAAGDYGRALWTCEQLQFLYGLRLPRNHPLIAINYFAMGKLKRLMNCRADASMALCRAKDIFEICCPDSQTMKQCREVYAEAVAEERFEREKGSNFGTY